MEKIPDEPIDEQEPGDDEDETESVTLDIQSGGHGQEVRI